MVNKQPGSRNEPAPTGRLIPTPAGLPRRTAPQQGTVARRPPSLLHHTRPERSLPDPSAGRGLPAASGLPRARLPRRFLTGPATAKAGPERRHCRPTRAAPAFYRHRAAPPRAVPPARPSPTCAPIVRQRRLAAPAPAVCVGRADWRSTAAQRPPARERVPGGVNGSSCHGAATGLSRAGPRDRRGPGRGGGAAPSSPTAVLREPAAPLPSTEPAAAAGPAPGDFPPALPCCPRLRGGRPGAPSERPRPRRGTGCRRIPPLPSRRPHEPANELGPSRQQETQASVQAAPGAAAAAGEEQRRRRRRGSG